MSILNQHVIIINSIHMAIEMLESKGSIYSGRELSPMLRLSGWGESIVFTQPGTYFRQLRACMHKVLGTQTAMSQHHHILEDKGRRFLKRVLSSPEDLVDSIRQ
jgi:hypothetical protein